MRVGICTDSSSQLPAELAARHEVEVVPMTITVGGTEFLDGVDLGADQFYAMLAADRTPVAALEPSPGQFAVAYDELVARGCTDILSVHAAANCGNLMAARVAARSVAVPVRLVESPAEGFGVGCCAIAAARAVARGASLDEAEASARTVAATTRSAFVVDARPLLHGPCAPVAVHASGATGDHMIGTAASLDEVVGILVSFVRQEGGRPRVGLGVADRQTAPVSAALQHALGTSADIECFRIGPSASPRFGPGTVVVCTVAPATG
jgi:fatty acid-binding protein DegV